MEKPDLNKLYQDAHTVSHENALESIWNAAVEWARKELKHLEFRTHDPVYPLNPDPQQNTQPATDTSTASVTDTNTATDTQSATATGTDTQSATATTS